MANRLLALAAAAALALPCATAQAMQVHAAFGASFLPPNPCDASDFGNLSGAELSGTFDMYYQYGSSGPLIRATPGAPAVGGIGCGASAQTGFDFDLAPGPGPGGEATLFLSFAGQLVTKDPGPINMPVYAFPAGLPSPPSLPDTAPLIELGVISVEKDPGPIQMPLFAFASPGHEIGYASADVRVVPVPAGAVLLASGLAALPGVRRRARRA